MNFSRSLFIFALLLTALAAPGPVRADVANPLYRGVRETLMGSAYTAVADDEEAVYLNPAGLAGVRGGQFNYFDSMTEISGDIVGSYTNSNKLLQGGLNTSNMNALVGKNIYAREQFTPTLLLPNFGMSLLVDGQAALMSQNAAFPQMTLGYQTTNGVQLAYGTTLWKKKKKKTSDELRVGIGGKFLFRRGGYDPITLTQALSEGKNILPDTMGDFRRGLGADLGLQYLHKSGRVTLSAGMAYTEIGNITFGDTAATQVGDWSVGVAARYQITPVTSLLLAYDYKYLNVQADYREKQHIGLELKLPIVSIYAGVNQTYFTYGLITDLWLFRISAGTYEEELDAIEGLEPERRYILGITMKLDL